MLDQLRATIRHAHPALDAQYGPAIEQATETISAHRRLLVHLCQKYDFCAMENEARIGQLDLTPEAEAEHRVQARRCRDVATVIRREAKAHVGMEIPAFVREGRK